MITLDFDHMHGVWVQDTRFKGSYGRIAWREDDTRFWVRWSYDGTNNKRESASVVDVEYLKLLSVGPEPWFAKCHYCGEYGMPAKFVQYNKREDMVSLEDWVRRNDSTGQTQIGYLVQGYREGWISQKDSPCGVT